MFDDPIIAEVRAARREISEECGNDTAKILEYHRRIIRDWRGKKITKEELDRQRQAAKVSTSAPSDQGEDVP